MFWALIVDEDTIGLGHRCCSPLVVATDWVDGTIARRTGQVSELGKVLDPVADRLAIAAGLIALVVRGAFPLWAAALILVRDVAVLVAGAAPGGPGDPDRGALDRQGRDVLPDDGDRGGVVGHPGLGRRRGARGRVATAAALLFGSLAVTTANAEEAKVKCQGANACKGKGACATATNACQGQNSCKGKSYVMLSKDECAAAQKKMEAEKKT